MARWIAFDQETTTALRSSLARGTKIETLRRGPVDYALARPGSVVAVLPATGTDGAGIAVFRRGRPVVVASKKIAESLKPVELRKADVAPMDHASRRAGGFLGLSDEMYEEEDTPQQTKSWWQKLWEE
jgi:hypothetical protein